MTESFTGTWTALVTSLRVLPFAARVWILAGTAALVVALAMLAPPQVQDEGYHAFAPTTMFGVADFGVVASNGAFLVVGLWGLWRIGFRRRDEAGDRDFRFYFGACSGLFCGGYFDPRLGQAPAGTAAAKPP